MVTMIATTGCLIPNDPDEPLDCPNLAPVIEPLTPVAAVNNVGIDACDNFLIDAEVMDADDRVNPLALGRAG